MSKLVIWVIWVAVFMLFGSCVGTPKGKKCVPLPDCPIKLDMAPNSVDDMYNNCERDMEKKMKTFLQTETQKNRDFREAWKKAENYYNKNWANNRLLEKEQIMALHAYTLNVPPLFCKFNDAVRTQKSQYKTKFPYHTLHFYLTMAVQTIKGNAGNCVKVYRRTNCTFTKNFLNKEIRLGAFSSSSMGGYPNEVFGTQSCFEITTCFGADISKFSKFPLEREVLIPPYEVFNLTDITKSSKKNQLPCEVVYTLESTNTTQSNLNCALIKKKHLHGFN